MDDTSLPRPWIVGSLTVHVLLPALFWALSTVSADLVATVLLAIHLGVPVVLIATFPWWRRYWVALLLLLLANHVVTFAVLAIGIQLFA